MKKVGITLWAKQRGLSQERNVGQAPLWRGLGWPREQGHVPVHDKHWPHTVKS